MSENVRSTRSDLLRHLLSPAGAPSPFSIFKVTPPPRFDPRTDKIGYGPRKNQLHPTNLAEAQGAYRLTLLTGDHAQILAAGQRVQEFRRKQQG